MFHKEPSFDHRRRRSPSIDPGSARLAEPDFLHTGNTFEEVAAFVAVATVAIRILWNASSHVLRWFGERLDAPTRSCQIELGPYEDIPEGVVLKCLIVRFGTDAYLEHMAPAQDRYEGRLRNIVRVVTPERMSDGRYRGKFDIPVHRRLGTQFKFFLEAPDIATAERVAALDYFNDPWVSRVDRPVKVWFLLDRFGTTKTVEGYTNNFWPAV